ncbi:MAG: hypothetical protein ACFFC9_01290 [Promethearchaeota archaeon]
MKVAFNRVSITPKDYIGKPLAGYTRKDPCLGKLDDIFAYGVLIESSSSKENNDFLLLISVDTLKLPLSITKYIKEKIKNNHSSIQEEQIIIHATHSHASFDLTGEFYWPGGTVNVMRGIMFGANRNDKFIVWFSNRIVKMVNELFDNLVSCKFSWKKEAFNPDLVFNRRDPEINIIPDLGVIVFKSLETNRIIGCIINYACHPTTLSYLNNKLSADYPGRIIHRIKNLTNGEVEAIYFNGPSGNLNPITTYRSQKEGESDRNQIYDQLGTYEHTREIGYTIAEEALKLINSISDNEFYSSMDFKILTKELWIPMKDARYFSKKWFINKLIQVIKKILLINVAKYQLVNSNFPIFQFKYRFFSYKCKTIIQHVIIQVKSNLSKKKLSILTIPGELFTSIGNKLLRKSATGSKNTFIFQNAQDWIAYLFTLKEYTEEGGYEVTPSFSPLCGYYIEKEMFKLMK